MTTDTSPMPPIPESFTNLMTETLGRREAAALLEGLQTPPAVAIRLNMAKQPSDVGTPIPWCPAGRRLNHRPTFALDSAWHQGRYYVQEPASMFAAFAAACVAEQEQRPLRMLDLCAAPGGKTTAAADALPPDSLVIANEFVPQRAEILLENLTKWGLPDMVVTRGDTTPICEAIAGQMDLVVADVPCSGEGMMRKEAEARRQWSPGLVKQCAELQRKIAANAAQALRRGGWMIYSTCTFNASENEENVEWICRELGFEVVDLPVDEAWNLQQHGPGYHFYPHLTHSEGLYLCLLRKTSPGFRARTKPSRLKTVKSTDVPWIHSEGYILVQHQNFIQAISEKNADFIGVFSKLPHTLTFGTQVASAGKRGWEPTHTAAMSQLLRNDYFPAIEFDDEQALRYLARRTDNLPTTAQRGFLLALHRQLPLGWLKGIGNRCNNLYPQPWRIRIPVP